MEELADDGYHVTRQVEVMMCNDPESLHRLGWGSELTRKRKVNKAEVIYIYID